MSDKVTIELSNEDAKLYKEFCQHYDKFKLLANSGFFLTRSASLMVNFDPNNVITDIRRSDVLYTRRLSTS